MHKLLDSGHPQEFTSAWLDIILVDTAQMNEKYGAYKSIPVVLTLNTSVKYVSSVQSTPHSSINVWSILCVWKSTIVDQKLSIDMEQLNTKTVNPEGRLNTTRVQTRDQVCHRKCVNQVCQLLSGSTK